MVGIIKRPATTNRRCLLQFIQCLGDNIVVVSLPPQPVSEIFWDNIAVFFGTTCPIAEVGITQGILEKIL